MNKNEFIMNTDKKQTVDGFIPEIVESIGYGTLTAIDPTTKNSGLVPLATKITIGEPGQERMVDNPDCYAQVLRFDEEEKFVYYIRMNTRGDISDPWGMYSDGLQNSRTARHRGTPEYEFHRVSERPFLYYLQYLVTRNLSLLRLAERDIKNA